MGKGYQEIYRSYQLANNDEMMRAELRRIANIVYADMPKLVTWRYLGPTRPVYNELRDRTKFPSSLSVERHRDQTWNEMLKELRFSIPNRSHAAHVRDIEKQLKAFNITPECNNAEYPYLTLIPRSTPVREWNPRNKTYDVIDHIRTWEIR